LVKDARNTYLISRSLTFVNLN